MHKISINMRTRPMHALWHEGMIVHTDSICGMKRGDKMIEMENISKSRVAYMAVMGAAAVILAVSATLVALGQEATQNLGSGGGMAEWISTEKINFTPAVYINAGKYSPEKSTASAVSGGTVGDNAASGLRITGNANDFNGFYVKGGKAPYTLSDSVINLSGNGSNDFVGLGAGAMADGGATLILKNVRITTNGVISSATASTSGSTLKVYNSTLISNGGQLPEGYKPKIGAGMMEPPAPLGISGTARTCLTLNNSASYFYDSTIIADGWGALSTDIAMDHVYLEANDCDVWVRGSGYGTYADWNCKVVINNSNMNVGTYAGIVAGPGEIHFTNTNAVSGGNCAMIHSVMRSDPTEIGILEIKGGKIATEDAVILIKSANADITLDGAQLTSKSGVLVRSMINTDPYATKPGDKQVPGIRVTLSNMALEGDILHEDTQRTMSLAFTDTKLKGAIKNASVSLDAGSNWTATADSTVTLNGNADVSSLDAPAGVTITASAGKGCTLKGSYNLAGGGTLNIK